jgi:hypothetical protein
MVTMATPMVGMMPNQMMRGMNPYMDPTQMMPQMQAGMANPMGAAMGQMQAMMAQQQMV